jgi:hypothetical protein
MGAGGPRDAGDPRRGGRVTGFAIVAVIDDSVEAAAVNRVATASAIDHPVEAAA